MRTFLGSHAVAICSAASVPTTKAALTPSPSLTHFFRACAGGASMVSGDPSRVIRAAKDTVVTCTDFVGSTHIGSQVQRLEGGDMLGLLDIAAARTAMNHVTGQKVKSSGCQFSVATIGADNTVFVGPALHGDVIEVTGKVVHAGSSSMGIFLRACRLPFTTVSKIPVAEAFFTMVAIDKSLRAAKIVPAVRLESQEERERHEEFKAIRAAQVDNDAYFRSLETRDVAVSEVDDAVNQSKQSHISVQATVTNATRLFFSAHLNLNQTIFGGEIMRWMEAHAVHCGRKFTRNRHVYSIAMHSVSFNQPIFVTDWVELRARVSFVRNTTMEVDVKLMVEREGHPIMTNRASFVLINTDETGQKHAVPVGLQFEGEEQRVLRHSAMAKHRYQRGKTYHDALKRKRDH